MSIKQGIDGIQGPGVGYKNAITCIQSLIYRCISTRISIIHVQNVYPSRVVQLGSFSIKADTFNFLGFNRIISCSHFGSLQNCL